MAYDYNAIKAQPLSPEPDGKIVSILPGGAGEASDEELRKLIVQLIESTPVRQHLASCPFRVLNSLAYATYMNLVSELDRAALVSLLETERECLGWHEQNARKNDDKSQPPI